VWHYQELYGTVIYFSQYLYNRRYLNQPTANKCVVIFANGLWVALPGLAIWHSIRLILTDSFADYR
jgi:hypothetical protein